MFRHSQCNEGESLGGESRQKELGDFQNLRVLSILFSPPDGPDSSRPTRAGRPLWLKYQIEVSIYLPLLFVPAWVRFPTRGQ